MGFKLGSQTSSRIRRGELKTKFNFLNKEDASVPGTPVIRVPLEAAGEANNDGSIYINKDIEPGSDEEREVLMHEMKHVVDMKIGKLDYGDDWIKWNGRHYERKDGMINFNGEWLEEGDDSFPWERDAYRYNK